jgi:hypothetical protein
MPSSVLCIVSCECVCGAFNILAITAGTKMPVIHRNM